MDPVSTVGTGVIVVPIALVVGAYFLAKTIRALRPIIRIFVLMFAILSFIGARVLLIALAAGMGWILQSGSLGQEWYMIAGGYGLWVATILWVVTPKYCRAGV